MEALEMVSRLRSVTGFEEEWLESAARHRSAPAVCHELLARCLSSASETDPNAIGLVRSLPLAQRDWLLLELRRCSFGLPILAEVQCPGCETVCEVELPAAELAPPHNFALQPADVELPRGSRAVIRPLTAADHECFAETKGLDGEARAVLALSRVLLDPGTQPLAGLAHVDREILLRTLALLTPEPVVIRMECYRCQRPMSATVDVCRFVLGEFQRNARTLLDDVHALASTYHWSEREILGLPLRRRLTYLMKIEAANDHALWRGKPV